MGERMLSVSAVRDAGYAVVTVKERDGRLQDVLVFFVDDSVVAWRNFCQHELDQELDTGSGPAMRDAELVCPKHGSTFDIKSGTCQNGPAAGTTLSEVEVAIVDGDVVLTDEYVDFVERGAVQRGADGPPNATSHLRL